MHEPTLTPRALLHAIVAEVAGKHAIAPESITMVQGRAASNVVQARAEVAARLFALGLKPQRIATLMKRDRETVLNYLRKATATQRGD